MELPQDFRWGPSLLKPTPQRPPTNPPLRPAPTGAIRRANDIIELGPTKIKGFPHGNRHRHLRRRDTAPTNFAAWGVNGVADLLIAAYEKGIVLWDTADAYGTHEAVKIALKKVPREKIIISTKTDAWDGPKTQADIDRFLKEFETDYIDILLLHTRLSPTWDKDDKAGMDVMSAAKEKKIIRAVGMSCHSVEAMQVAAKNAWMDICMIRLNPDGYRMDDQPSVVMPVVAQLKAAGKGVFGIKVLGEGTLADSSKGGGGSELAAGSTKIPRRSPALRSGQERIRLLLHRLRNAGQFD